MGKVCFQPMFNLITQGNRDIYFHKNVFISNLLWNFLYMKLISPDEAWIQGLDHNWKTEVGQLDTKRQGLSRKFALQMSQLQAISQQ